MNFLLVHLLKGMSADNSTLFTATQLYATLRPASAPIQVTNNVSFKGTVQI